jgi:hypothetical protein
VLSVSWRIILEKLITEKINLMSDETPKIGVMRLLSRLPSPRPEGWNDDWREVCNAKGVTLYWIEPDGTRHPPAAVGDK